MNNSLFDAEMNKGKPFEQKEIRSCTECNYDEVYYKCPFPLRYMANKSKYKPIIISFFYGTK